MSAQDAVVSLRNVTKSFGAGGVTALQSIDLDVQHGELVSLIGPSGCGKSTLLRIVGNLVEPTSGEVVVNGKSARQARLDRDYGIVFQDAVLYDWRTVAKNIALPLELAGWDGPRQRNESRRCWSSSSYTASGTTTRGSCQAGCSSACPSLGPSPSRRRCSSWTSPSARSTR